MGFFDNISKNSGLFFWVFVVLVFVLLGLSLFLLYKNKKLKELVEKEKDGDFYSSSEDFISIEKDDSSSLAEDNIQTNEDVKEDIQIINEEDNSEVNLLEDIKEDNSEVEGNTPGIYQKNVLREMSKKMPISPIHIDNNVENYDDFEEEMDEMFLKEDSVSPLESMEDVYEDNDNMRFASEIVSRMEEEIAPSNIELTDYEKKQEEEAIISYDELQKVKDRIYNITEEEETDEFIDELRNFSFDLKA